MLPMKTESNSIIRILVCIFFATFIHIGINEQKVFQATNINHNEAVELLLLRKLVDLCVRLKSFSD